MLPAVLDGGGAPEALVAVLPSVEPSRVVARRLARIAVDGDHDFALLKMDGPVLRSVTFRDWAPVVEGDMLLFAS